MSRNNPKAKIINFSLTVAFCLLLIFLNPKGFFSPIRLAVSTVLSPIEKIFYLAGGKIGNSLQFFGSISKLKKENIRLLKENNFLVGEVSKLSEEKRENQILREQLELVPKNEFDLVASFVIGQDPQGLESWLMIDRGKNDGVEAGMAVIVSGGILVGKIEEVYPSSAKVNVLSSSRSNINAVGAKTGSKGIVRGEFGLGLIMDMVSQTDILTSGDDVVTSGLGGNVPKGLLIGKIKEVRVTDDRLFQRALISPRVEYSKLDVIFVIKNTR